jgi:tetratricopeptide (TPR) repeat protein
MATTDSQTENVNDVEAALLDAELFVKYQAPERAIKCLLAAIERNTRSLQLRERLREICGPKYHEEAARQCLTLASLYIDREDFDTAYDRLLEAKQLDERINIASGLEAIRRARRPDLKPPPTSTEANFERKHFTLAGDLSAISVFDTIQVIENAKLTGLLTISGTSNDGYVMFNDGRIVDAECDGEVADRGFQNVVEITSGTFEFQKTPDPFPGRIRALSNTNLLLDTLRLLDEKKQ